MLTNNQCFASSLTAVELHSVYAMDVTFFHCEILRELYCKYIIYTAGIYTVQYNNQ